jgi:hypothetical protein
VLRSKAKALLWFGRELPAHLFLSSGWDSCATLALCPAALLGEEDEVALALEPFWFTLLRTMLRISCFLLGDEEGEETACSVALFFEIPRSSSLSFSSNSFRSVFS